MKGIRNLAFVASDRSAHLRIVERRAMLMAGRPVKSAVLTLVEYVQPELPTFEAHQHLAKLLPRDLSAINNKDRQAAIFVFVPFDLAAHNTIGDMQAKITVREVLCR
jgi:hypothetical protein